MKYPFGKCEHDCGCNGPAAYTGGDIKVCTRCTLPGGEYKPLFDGTTPMRPFLEWDSLGAAMMMFDVK